MAKYGNSEEAVLKSLEEKKNDLRNWKTMRNWRLPQKPSLRSRSGFWDFSADGSRRREKKAAKILENRITEELEDLNFLHVEFRVDVHRTDHFTAAGSDEVEF